MIMVSVRSDKTIIWKFHWKLSILSIQNFCYSHAMRHDRFHLLILISYFETRSHFIVPLFRQHEESGFSVVTGSRNWYTFVKLKHNTVSLVWYIKNERIICQKLEIVLLCENGDLHVVKCWRHFLHYSVYCVSKFGNRHEQKLQ